MQASERKQNDERVTRGELFSFLIDGGTLMTHVLECAKISRLRVAAALVMALILSIAGPVLAETAGQRSTRNIILGGVAAAVGIILYNNYHHKQVAHNTIVGYTRDGGTVYADGRIVYPDGSVLYTGTGNRQPGAWDGSRQYCGNTAMAYYPQTYQRGRGHHDKGDGD